MPIATEAQQQRYKAIAEALKAHPGQPFTMTKIIEWMGTKDAPKDVSNIVNALARPEDWSEGMRHRLGLKGWVMPLQRGTYLYDPDAVTTFKGAEDWVIKSPVATKMGYEDGYALRGYAKKKLWLGKIGVPPVSPKMLREQRRRGMAANDNGSQSIHTTAEPVTDSFVQQYPSIATGFDLVEVLARTDDGIWVVRDADGKATVLRVVG